MAAGDIYQGKNVRFSFNSKTLYHATSCALSVSASLEEIATKDTEGTISTPGNYSWSLTTNALVADKPALSTQSDFMDIMDLLLSKQIITVELSDGETGSWKLAGSVYVENANVTAEVGQTVTGDFSFKGTGDLVKTINT